jgi:hypothetical protein
LAINNEAAPKKRGKGGPASDWYRFARSEHDPEKWNRFSEKIMLNQNARAQIASI